MVRRVGRTVLGQIGSDGSLGIDVHPHAGRPVACVAFRLGVGGFGRVPRDVRVGIHREVGRLLYHGVRHARISHGERSRLQRTAARQRDRNGRKGIPRHRISAVRGRPCAALHFRAGFVDYLRDRAAPDVDVIHAAVRAEHRDFIAGEVLRKCDRRRERSTYPHLFAGCDRP